MIQQGFFLTNEAYTLLCPFEPSKFKMFIVVFTLHQNSVNMTEFERFSELMHQCIYVYMFDGLQNVSL